MKRTILFSFFLSLFAFNLNAQVDDYSVEMAKQEGLLQASIAKSDLQRNLEISLTRYEIALGLNDELEMKEVESAIATQLDAMINLQSDAAEKSKRTSLLRKSQTLNTKDKSSVKAVMSEIRALGK